MSKKIAHPVWDLSNGDEGPVIVRKVDEGKERPKTVDLGWLGKNVATYIGGQPVQARVAAVNRDGTYDLMTPGGDVMENVAEEFIYFLARRGGAESVSPSHKSADIWSELSRERKKKEREQNKRDPKPPFKKETPTERWWQRLKKKRKEREDSQSATPAQDVEPEAPQPDEFAELVSRLPRVDPNYKKPEKATDVGGGAKFDPNDPTVTGENIRPLLESLKGSLDAHRMKYLKFLFDKIKWLKDSGANQLEIDQAEQKLLWWVESQRINQKTLNQIHEFLEQTTIKDKSSPYTVGVGHGKTPAAGSKPGDPSQPVVMTRGTGGPVAEEVQERVRKTNGDYDAARNQVMTEMRAVQDDQEKVNRLQEIYDGINDYEQYASQTLVDKVPKDVKKATDGFLDKAGGDFDAATKMVQDQLAAVQDFDSKHHLNMVLQQLQSLKALSKKQQTPGGGAPSGTSTAPSGTSGPAPTSSGTSGTATAPTTSTQPAQSPDAPVAPATPEAAPAPEAPPTPPAAEAPPAAEPAQATPATPPTPATPATPPASPPAAPKAQEPGTPPPGQKPEEKKKRQRKPKDPNAPSKPKSHYPSKGKKPAAPADPAQAKGTGTNDAAIKMLQSNGSYDKAIAYVDNMLKTNQSMTPEDRSYFEEVKKWIGEMQAGDPDGKRLQQRLKKKGNLSVEAQNLQGVTDFNYVMSILTHLGFDIKNKQAVREIMTLRSDPSLATFVDRIPDDQWLTFIGTAYRENMPMEEILRHRPRWWQHEPTKFKQNRPNQEQTEIDPNIPDPEYREQEGDPWHPMDPRWLDMDQAVPEEAKPREELPEDESVSLEEAIYKYYDEEEQQRAIDELKKKRVAQAVANVQEWLYWMDEAGFPVTDYNTVIKLANMFPDTSATRLLRKFTPQHFDDLAQSGAIDEYNRTMQESMHNKMQEPAVEDEPVEVEPTTAPVASEPTPEPKRAPPKSKRVDEDEHGVATKEPQIMPGFHNGMELMSHDRNKIRIDLGGPRNRGKREQFATVGMAVWVRLPGTGLGYIVGATPQGNLMVWIKRSGRVREVPPEAVEQDMHKTRMARIIAAMRKIYAQNMDPTKPVAPGSAPPISNTPPPPGAPNLPVGSDGKPLGVGSGVQMVNAPGDPKGEGTVTEINPDGSFLYTSTQGTPEAVKPDQKMNVKVIPPAPGQSGIPGQSPG